MKITKKDIAAVVAFVVIVLWLFSQPIKEVGAATLDGRIFPYYRFIDGEDVRFCMQPNSKEDLLTDCFTLGEKLECDVLPEDQGYIRCPKPK